MSKEILPMHSYITVWLQTIGQTKPSQPEFMDVDTKKFNMELIREEVNELLHAMEANDFTEMCDGYFDALWVITQAAMFNGININDIIRAGFQSNMSKFCKSVEEAEETVDAYTNGTHPNKMGTCIPTYYEQVNDLYVVRRSSDNKVMKSINFREPDFSFILDRMTKDEVES